MTLYMWTKPILDQSIWTRRPPHIRDGGLNLSHQHPLYLPQLVPETVINNSSVNKPPVCCLGWNCEVWMLCWQYIAYRVKTGKWKGWQFYIYTLWSDLISCFSQHISLWPCNFRGQGSVLLCWGSAPCYTPSEYIYIFSHGLLNSLLPVRLIHWLFLIQKFLEIFCMLMVLPVCTVTVSLLFHVFVIHIVWLKQSHIREGT